MQPSDQDHSSIKWKLPSPSIYPRCPHLLKISTSNSTRAFSLVMESRRIHTCNWINSRYCVTATVREIDLGDFREFDGHLLVPYISFITKNVYRSWRVCDTLIRSWFLSDKKERSSIPHKSHRIARPHSMMASQSPRPSSLTPWHTDQSTHRHMANIWYSSSRKANRPITSNIST